MKRKLPIDTLKLAKKNYEFWWEVFLRDHTTEAFTHLVVWEKFVLRGYQ